MHTPARHHLTKLNKLILMKAYTMLVLEAESKKFAIHIDPVVGKSLQIYLAQEERQRPLTHDLFAMICNVMQVKLLHVILYDLQDSVYFAKILMERKVSHNASHNNSLSGDSVHITQHIIELDARPSDAITLALLQKVSIWTTEGLLDKVTFLEQEPI